MTLPSGARLGPFEILAPLGAGGMGEVYRARDTRLGREVAVKLLPELFAADPDRLMRFDREARALASLNHPHIAQIYGTEEGSGTRALIMELVEGEDLAQQIARGPIAVDDALAIARQIADALESAHDSGVIHRDLKPSNVMVREDGTVKVLDFGLAKALGPETTAGSDPADSPTFSMRATQLGVIMGTASYMSPEQARGRAVDKRTDVWAFGCVLFEMLTGSKAFAGDDATEIIAAVVKSEPDWRGMPATVPPHVREVVSRCLAKDRKSRVPDLSVVRYLLDAANAPVPPPGPAPVAAAGSTRAWKAAAAVFLLTTVGAGIGWYRGDGVPPAAGRFEIAPPAGTTFTAGGIRGVAVPVISPDGRTIAFTALDASGRRQLWVRGLDSVTARPLPGTDGAGYPFWSPDSRSLGFAVTGQLRRIDLAGGPPTTVCQLHPGILSRGGTWSKDGVIVFNNGPATLYRAPAAGGEATPIGTLGPDEVGRQFPAFLPDGRRFLYSGAGPEGSAVYVGSLDSGDSTRLLAASSGALYDAESRQLLFVRRGTLMAQRFDVKSLALTGDPVSVVEGVEASVVPGIVAFSLAETGTLVYGLASAEGERHRLTWVDRHGKAVGAAVGPHARYRGISVSIDGSQLAAHRHDGDGGDIWVTDLSRNRTSRLTFQAEQENASPVWSPDGTRIAYGSIRGGKPGIYVKAANNTGEEELLYEASSSRFAAPHGWSPDGTFVLFGVVSTDSGRDLWTVRVGGERTAVPLLRSGFSESHGQISPDGRWLAYVSDETGAAEVYVRPVSGGGKWAVSNNGGRAPRWRGDSAELFYLSTTHLVAVDVTSAGAAFISGDPRELFSVSTLALGAGHQDHFSYAASADGSRFLVTERGPGVNEAAPPIVLVLDWANGNRR